MLKHDLRKNLAARILWAGGRAGSLQKHPQQVPARSDYNLGNSKYAHSKFERIPGCDQAFRSSQSYVSLLPSR